VAPAPRSCTPSIGCDRASFTRLPESPGRKGARQSGLPFERTHQGKGTPARRRPRSVPQDAGGFIHPGTCWGAEAEPAQEHLSLAALLRIMADSERNYGSTSRRGSRLSDAHRPAHGAPAPPKKNALETTQPLSRLARCFEGTERSKKLPYRNRAPNCSVPEHGHFFRESAAAASWGHCSLRLEEQTPDGRHCALIAGKRSAASPEVGESA